MTSAVSSVRQHTPYIIDGSRTAPIGDFLEGLKPTADKVHFTFLVFQRTLDSLINRRYSDFDAQTTSNCCHGMSILVRDLIRSIKDLNLPKLRQELTTESESANHLVPQALIDLAQLYTLTYVREIEPDKGVRTAHKKLRDILSVGSRFSEDFVKMLQKKHSTNVALRYSELVKSLSPTMTINQASVKEWGEYVSPSYLRTDSQSVHYAPCMFSMQVSLAYLIYSRATIAFINDMLNEAGDLSKRDVRILRGDGSVNFSPASLDDQDPNEPVIVFGGCSYTSDPDAVSKSMDQWIGQFPSLVLACDIHYPQFPKVQNDLLFNRDPIIPKELTIQDAINRQKIVRGVSADEASLFCLNHIYSVSSKQLVQETASLPSYKIPPCLKKS